MHEISKLSFITYIESKLKSDSFKVEQESQAISQILFFTKICYVKNWAFFISHRQMESPTNLIRTKKL